MEGGSYIHIFVHLFGCNCHVLVSVLVYLFYFFPFLVITEVGSKKDQDHPSVAGLESKWCSRLRSLSSFSLRYQYTVKQKC